MSATPPPIHQPPPLPKARLNPPWAFVGASVAIFGISLVLPALRMENGDVWRGGQVLGVGLFGVFLGQFGWFANVFWLASTIFLILRKTIVTILLAVAAVVIGLSSWQIVNAQIPLDEAGVNKTTVRALGPAFYVWLVALGAPAVSSLLIRQKRKPSAPST